MPLALEFKTSDGSPSVTTSLDLDASEHDSITLKELKRRIHAACALPPFIAPERLRILAGGDDDAREVLGDETSGRAFALREGAWPGAAPAPALARASASFATSRAGMLLVVRVGPAPPGERRAAPSRRDSPCRRDSRHDWNHDTASIDSGDSNACAAAAVATTSASEPADAPKPAVDELKGKSGAQRLSASLWPPVTEWERDSTNAPPEPPVKEETTSAAPATATTARPPPPPPGSAPCVQLAPVVCGLFCGTAR